MLCGDFNVAPEPRDVYDAAKVEGEILFHPEERAAFARFLGWGLRDALRLHYEEGGLYSWWDYRAAAFRRNLGFRIDHTGGAAPRLPLHRRDPTAGPAQGPQTV